MAFIQVIFIVMKTAYHLIMLLSLVLEQRIHIQKSGIITYLMQRKVRLSQKNIRGNYQKPIKVSLLGIKVRSVQDFIGGLMGLLISEPKNVL